MILALAGTPPEPLSGDSSGAGAGAPLSQPISPSGMSAGVS